MKPFAITHVLAPTDMGEAVREAMGYARLFADRFAAKLTVMYSDAIVYPVDFVGPAQTFYVTATPEHQARLRDEVERVVAPLMAGRQYDIHVTIGQPIQAILAAARERKADLIVVGSHPRRGWRHAILGSVREGVLHGGDCPVLVVSPREERATPAHPPAVTKIVCPVNFSDTARESLVAAAGVARTLGARLVIVHVLEPGATTAAVDGERKIRQWIDPAFQDQCTYLVLGVEGSAAERVLDWVEDFRADLLVIGAQHKFFRDATVIGTTTERIVRFAPCPVLVVPRQPVARRKAETKEDRELVAAR